jgi:Kdo2-lipid IVA lauroyltransferase/acyltransferase
MTASAQRPQAPVVGWPRRILGPFHFSGIFWFRLPFWAMSWLDGRLFDAMILLFTCGFLVALRQVRLALAANLEPVLGPAGYWQRQRRAFLALQNFAYCLGERYEFLQYPERFVVEVEGTEHLQAASLGGQGLIFVTAHIGAWETTSKRLSDSLGREAHVVREEEIDGRSQAFMQQLVVRQAGKACTTHFASDDQGLGLELLAALRRGEVVALQGDRPRAGGRTVTASVFGRALSLPEGPMMLARASGVALVPTFSFREGRRTYRVFLREPIRVTADVTRALATSAAAQRLAGELEWAIERAPYQWFCLRRLWT